MQQTVQDWARNTSGTPLYAVLANTNGAQGIKAYYREDGSRTPYGLYANTPYANWFEVMPVLVPLTDGSPFLRWVAETPLRNWGWLARSPLPQVAITDHLRGLTQVILPGGKAVFFRYWDGRFLPAHLRYMGEHWIDVLPVFSDYWINGEVLTCPVDPTAQAQVSPWWQVPQRLIDQLLKTDPGPVIAQALQQLQETRADLYGRFSPALLEMKIRHLLVQSHGQREGLMARIVTTLESE
ncbi:DUF4123 domain-containing protein [Serratia fonticola]|uniref:DUF4123 domain-containing protein n=1 Tax=Serratia fonticola TaxID=47917 RepID=A0AAW3WNH6_SERFO|nr:DUF4123 domain-containing protein [Serratia fonticola]MBC3211995.1 DUF4123 domain-containing protein [Serratia fonticola]NYA13556.1 DUF4123 domain-containing protein [Serratia fonticola]NYA33366.1 DUF4123 domain-containing protein [Serratia fonticola]